MALEPFSTPRSLPAVLASPSSNSTADPPLEQTIQLLQGAPLISASLVIVQPHERSSRMVTSPSPGSGCGLRTGSLEVGFAFSGASRASRCRTVQTLRSLPGDRQRDSLPTQQPPWNKQSWQPSPRLTTRKHGMIMMITALPDVV